MYIFETKKVKIELTDHDLILKGMTGHDLMRDIKNFVKKLSLINKNIDFNDPVIKEISKLELDIKGKKELFNICSNETQADILKKEISDLNNQMTNLSLINFEKLSSISQDAEMPDIDFMETYELYKRILLACNVSASSFDSEETTQDEHYKLIAQVANQVRGDLENLFKSSHLIKFL